MHAFLVAAGKVERASDLFDDPEIQAFYLLLEDAVSDAEMGVPLNWRDGPLAAPPRLQILLLARRGSREAGVLTAAAEREWLVVVEALLLPPLFAGDECFFAAIPERVVAKRI
jgi:hypothetical protein